MAKFNRWDVVAKIKELAPVTKSGISDAFADAGDAEKVDSAFDAARRHDLIESRSGDGGQTEWVVSAKGERKLAAR